MVTRPIIILLCGMSFCNLASSQNTNVDLIKKSNIYFLKNSGQLVDKKDSADYIRVISPPDSTDLNLYVVRDFYTDGKPKLMGKTLMPVFYLKRQGAFVEFFHNGHRKSVKNYENNAQQGDEVYYYPNGKIYYTGTLDPDKWQTHCQ